MSGHQRTLILSFSTLSLFGGMLIGAEPASNRRAATQSSAKGISTDRARVGELQQRIDQLESENRQLRQSAGSGSPATLSVPRTVSSPGALPAIQVANAEMISMPDNPLPDNQLGPIGSIPVPPSRDLHSELSCTETEKKPGEGDWKTKWNHGIEFVSPDKAFKVHIGGRTQFDSILVGPNPGALKGTGGIDGQTHDSDFLGFRRARLRADGTIYETIEYCAEFDFMNSTSRDSGSGNNIENNTINVTAPTDLWFIFKEFVFGANLKVGNFKEPIGFEHNTSSRWLNFLERSFLQDLYAGPFNNGFSQGAMIYNTWDEENGTWWLGAFRNNANVFGYNVGNDEYALDGRVTYTPLYCHDCERVVHFGFAGSVRDPDQATQRFRARSLRNGTGNQATIYGDTGSFTSNRQYLATAEFVVVDGPLSFESEWIGSWNRDCFSIPGTTKGFSSGNPATSLGSVFTNAYYFETLYFLTGESREYERKNGAFGRVVPLRNFSWKNCCNDPGAWQVGFRYGVADLNDGKVKGGYLQEYTLGLNWFLNPNMKVQWNYAALQRDSQLDKVHGGVIHQFGMRLAHDF